MTRLRKMKGFTLIELIVVVIIIGVLAAIAAVAYNSFVGDARLKAITASAVQVQKAIAASTAQADSFTAANVATGTANIQGATVGALTAAGNVKVINGTRSACLSYGATPAPGSNATTIVYGTDTNVACA